MIGRYAVLLLGVFAGSMSVILIRSSHAPPFVLAAMRLVVAGIAVVVFSAPTAPPRLR